MAPHIPAVNAMRRLKKFFTPPPGEAAAHSLYTALVTTSRRPALYTVGGVADTVDGRFDLIVLHLYLAIERLRREPEGSLARQAETPLLEVFFADMDQSLREMGVGDLSVGRRVHDMAGAFFGRVQAYEAALAAHDGDGGTGPLADAIRRNLYRGETRADAGCWMAAYVLSLRAALAAASAEDLLAGRLPQAEE